MQKNHRQNRRRPVIFPYYDGQLGRDFGTMQRCTTKAELRESLADLRAAKGGIGLVTTMGYLHDGHMELVRRAVAENEAVAASIFVNPTQFGPNEDLSTYPRDMKRDLALLKDVGVDVVFTPDPDEMYVDGAQTIVENTALSRVMIGKVRPGHFRGVATVVAKLFNIFQPDRAYFGEKDYQQLVVIKRMVADLDFPVTVIGVPTVREPDGLAMSSRNVRLSPEDRAAAVVLNAALNSAEAAAATLKTATALKKFVANQLAMEPRGTIESVDVRHADTLAPASGQIKAPVVLLLAVRFGPILLIDQRVVTPAL